MNREEQREIRQLRKLIPVELRKQRKEFGLQFAYGTLYTFEGDFLYSAILDIPSFRVGILSNGFFIKPWVLDDLYWEIQQMDMDEMRAQPKSLHVRGAFAINDIYYQKEIVEYDREDFGQTLHDALIHLDAKIEEHKKRLTGIEVITDDLEGYRLSNLTKAVALMYHHDYERALHLLLQEDKVGDTFVHADSSGKMAKDYAVEFCRAKQYGQTQLDL
jgi:hypothetical protein